MGGWLADKVGGVRMLLALYAGVALMMASVSSLPPLSVVTVLLFVGMMCLGMGNGSVFQLVPQRFQQEIGVITGIVGAGRRAGRLFSAEHSWPPEAVDRILYPRFPHIERYRAGLHPHGYLHPGRMEADVPETEGGNL
ncbi:hypothetical protein HMSSN139_54040 [Paenibacillus sp. HMSSN-139]|nr:hypothetical protein HMSSN139_54040 [Paenibacillus sp. HMSSN-139]